jgi:hypothetical protein
MVGFSKVIISLHVNYSSSYKLHMLLLCQGYEASDLCGALFKIVTFNIDTGMKDSSSSQDCKKKS